MGSLWQPLDWTWIGHHNTISLLLRTHMKINSGEKIHINQLIVGWLKLKSGPLTYQSAGKAPDVSVDYGS